VTGHAEHEIRDGLCRLGQQGHRPETANMPHD
jgi:hypothetical protein